MIRTLVAVPGATYAAAVDERSGALLAESGAAGSGAALTTLLTWARRAASLRGPDGLDDLVVTTDTAFHVLRRGVVSGLPVWTYLRVDRHRGNLALARRAAASAGAAPARPRALPSRPLPTSPGGSPSALPKRPLAALPAPRAAAGPRPWPRQPPAAPAAPVLVHPDLPATTSGWSVDTATLRRLLAGLQRLA